MRRIAIGLLLGVSSRPDVASARIPGEGQACATPPWSPEPFRIEHSVVTDGSPVDTQIWLRVPCETITSGCSLVADDHAVALTSATSGDAVCSLAYADVYDVPLYLLVLTPKEVLLPAHAYRLECGALVEKAGGGGLFEIEEILVVTRPEATAASSPDEVVVTRARQIRGDESLCGCDRDDALGLTLSSLDAAYLREGGWIEVTYPNGQVFPVTAASETDDGEVLLPYTRGSIAVTPVAADGARGATVTVGPGEIDDQAVYIPCRSSLAGPSRALWWLVPVLWIGARRRRRSR